ncbi:MAG: 4-(cytidine 5'-diphospho)-2-C-methyl-D-erythritol kinase, partial [Thermotoga sp.]
MIFKSYAKINLYLDVVGKRDDGYHDILSVFQSISLYDLMTIDEKKGKDVSFFSNDP